MDSENPYTHRGELVDGGNDFLVFDFIPGFVVKYPNTEKTNHSPYDNTSLEFYNHLVADDRIIREIMGDNLAQTSFLPPDQKSGFNYRIIQPKYERNQFLRYLTPEGLENFIIEHKEEFKLLLDKAKQVEAVFGIPLDLTPRNIVYADNRLIIIENDCTSLRYKYKAEMKDKIDRDRRTMAYVENLIK